MTTQKVLKDMHGCTIISQISYWRQIATLLVREEKRRLVKEGFELYVGEVA